MGQGVWAGTLKLCRASVTGMELTSVDGASALTIRFSGEAQKYVAAMTARAAGGPLAVRLSGKVVVAPYVAEAITGDSLQITAADLALIERLRPEIDKDC